MKLWGGRFEKNTAGAMDDFNSSIHFDARLYAYDIQGSIAHVKMLGKCGIIPQSDAELITRALQEIKADIDAGKMQFDVHAEDIHMNIEMLLIERIGEPGKKLHTGRSRNDQVALDMRMYMRDAIKTAIAQLGALENTLLATAEANVHTIVSGYTHMQKAQPITLAHHITAYVQMFLRDMDRLADCYKRTNVMPLGSGALAGTTYPIDRGYVAEQLGFAGITRNSIDGVADRDFCIEYLSCASLIMMHLSRFCEELILWCSDEFRFIELDDGYSTGSSIMPQKKNPDAAELIRGKTGRVYGSLMSLLAVMKSLPLAYNKDMQEDKEAVFDAVDTLSACLTIFEKMFSTLKINEAAMLKGAGGGFTNATDCADYLVKKGMSFRQAHEVTGQLVLYCIKSGKTIECLTLDEFTAISPVFGADIYDAVSLENCVNRRRTHGGPAPEAVRDSIELSRRELEAVSGRFLEQDISN